MRDVMLKRAHQADDSEVSVIYQFARIQMNALPTSFGVIKAVIAHGDIVQSVVADCPSAEAADAALRLLRIPEPEGVSQREILEIDTVARVRIEPLAPYTPGANETCPCETCGRPTRMTATKRCDGCWEVERRLKDYVRQGGAKAIAVGATRREGDTGMKRRIVLAYELEDAPRDIDMAHLVYYGLQGAVGGQARASNVAMAVEPVDASPTYDGVVEAALAETFKRSSE